MTRFHCTPDGSIPFTPEEEAEWDAIEAAWAAGAGDRARLDRNRLLTETDWSQTVDTPQPIKDKYAAYRQALRDVPQQPGFPNNIQWPVKPE